ncbi:MAG: response regulator [Deltaproteobacteria bacterium]|nr:response regulator [Deltaproteobacteria bacterium]
MLVVEDDGLLRNAYRRTLEQRYGARVDEAADVPAAKKTAESGCFDLCIVDHNLPGGSGLELIGQLRASQRSAKIVLITGYGSMELAVAAIRGGADEVFAKPVSVAEILRRLAGETNDARGLEPAPLSHVVWEHIQRVLADCNGNRSEAARRLQIDRGTLHRWLSRARPDSSIERD